MVPIIYFILLSVVCVGIIGVFFAVYSSKHKRLSSELVQAREELQNLGHQLETARRNEEALKKKVFYLSCKIKAEEIKSKLEELQTKARKAKRGNLWRGVAKTAFRTVLITGSVFGLPGLELLPDIPLPSPDISALLNGVDIDGLLPEDYDFEELSGIFEGPPELEDQALAAIDLENLAGYEAQLDQTLQELNRALASFDN